MAACSLTKGEPSTAEAKTPPSVMVETETAGRSDVMRRIDVVATLDPWEEATLYAKVSGYLKAISVDRGDRVRQGHLLAVLDIPEMNDEYKRIDAEENRDKAEVQKAQADVHLQNLTMQRLQAIHAEEPGATTPQELDLASGKLEAARATDAAAQSRLVATTAERVRLDTMMEYRRILAPFDGVVTERYVDPGALITAGTQSKPTPVVKVVSAARLRAMVDVPERDVAHLRIGASARLRVDAYPDRTFTATVSRFSRALDPQTRTMRTEVLVANGDGALTPGMFGRISLDLERRANVITLTPAGVRFQKDQAYVFVAAKDHARRVDLTIGVDDGVRLEVVSGLTGGEAIIVKASAPLADGMPIAVKPAPTATSSR
ncbi:MAG: efflux RND transporter periplasmic adaptor subunit [Acidobacteria bacterium]|nr:efflux RND transporter periplasmic adaptor subunit [Acidobacteriota bacterium]